MKAYITLCLLMATITFPLTWIYAAMTLHVDPKLYFDNYTGFVIVHKVGIVGTLLTPMIFRVWCYFVPEWKQTVSGNV